MARYRLAILMNAVLLAAAFPAAAEPNLEPGVWMDITPSSVTTGSNETCIGQGLAVDYQNPSTIYWGTTPYNGAAGGLFKTTDGGSSWRRVAKVTPAWNGASDHLEMPVHVRVDPRDSNRLYVGDGVRGSAQGFFVSTDAGENFVKPQGFTDARNAAGIGTEDVYDVAVDPTDFDHVLVSFHSAWGWTDTQWGGSAGIMESKDGGDSWIIHEPIDSFGTSYGHSIHFLYDPDSGTGDSNSWLWGTQDAGFYRTTNAGSSWTKVHNSSISHGGATIYYTGDGTLYASGANKRSSDNGATWTNLDTKTGTSWCIYGDGTQLWTGGGWGYNQPFKVSSESDGLTWANYSSQAFEEGPYSMDYDSTNGILYASVWSLGVWALKVGEGTGVIPDPPAGGASSGGSGSSSGGAASGGTPGTSPGGQNAAGGSTNQGSGGSGTSAVMPGGAANDITPEDAGYGNVNPGCTCSAPGSRTRACGASLLLSLLGLTLWRRRCTSWL